MRKGSRFPRGIVAVVAGLAAVSALLCFWLWPKDPLAVIPNDPGLRMPFACHSCGKIVHLAPRERMELQQKASRTVLSGSRAMAPEAQEGEITSSRKIILGCPLCGQVELRKAFICARCDTPFPGELRGKPQKCPVCGWQPASRP